MKKLIALIFVFLFCSPSWAKEYKCSEHNNFLVLKEGGFEHVNHNLLLNGKTLIKELEQAMWFIEEVKCTSNGFEIIASHIQYGDPAKQKFVLKVTGPLQYEIK